MCSNIPGFIAILVWQSGRRHHSVILLSLLHEPSTGASFQLGTSGSEDALCRTSRMPLQLYGADFVMTQRWGHRAKLDGDLKQAHRKLAKTCYVASPLPSTLSPPLEAAVSSQQLTAERKSTRFRANVNSQVRTLPGRYAILLLITLVLISQPTMGKPWSNEQPDHVIFRSQICQPVPPSNLQMFYDKNNMASNIATDRAMLGSETIDPNNDGFQGDDPRVDRYNDDTNEINEEGRWKSKDNIWAEEKDENVQDSNGVILETRKKELLEIRSWLPRRKVLNRHIDNTVSNNKRSRGNTNNTIENNLADNSENKRRVGNSDSYTYMRRRRRASGNRETQSPTPDQDVDDTVNNDDVDREDHATENDGDIDAKSKKSTNSIQLQLFLSGKDKKQRKKLKKQLRQMPQNLSKPPPWECKFSQKQRQMNKGVFPEWILEGKCETDKCFYRLYNCEEIKYTLKLLYRDPTKCNPLPNVSNTTVFEERWELRPSYIVVGCNCVSPLIKNPKSKEHKKKVNTKY